MNWRDTTQSYRMGFVEGEAGERNVYLLEAAVSDYEEYNRGFADGLASKQEFEAKWGVEEDE